MRQYRPEVEPDGSADVIVCGAGPAGLCAAIAAGRSGARVLLIERYGFVGGMSTAALVYPWMTFHDRAGQQVVHGLAQEIVDRLRAVGGSPGHLRDTVGFVHSLTPFDPDLYRIVADRMLAEAGCRVLHHALLADVGTEGDRLTAVSVQTLSGRLVFQARTFVDATGDATLCCLAGLPMQEDVIGSAVQPMTMCFRVGGVDLGPVDRYIRENPDEFHEATLVGHQPLTGVSGFFSLWREAELPVPRDRLLFFAGTRPGQAYMNTSRILGRDGTDPAGLSEAEREGRRQADVICRFLRERVAGFAESYLDCLPAQVGIRETRRIRGEFTLTADHACQGARFEDAVARSAYPIDIHSPTGSGMVFSGPPRAPYDIPFRCLVPVGVRNVLAAGRCISATHEGHASTRLTPTCMMMGESAGRAAAWSALSGRDVREWEPEVRV